MELPSPLELRVVGLTFRKAYPAFVYKLGNHLPARVKLKRRPNNKHDSNAVAVLWDKQLLGYIGSNMAKRLAPELDKGIKWKAWATSVSEHPEHPNQPGLWITAERIED